jgi:hypothetical protein
MFGNTVEILRTEPFPEAEDPVGKDLLRALVDQFLVDLAGVVVSLDGVREFCF